MIASAIQSTSSTVKAYDEKGSYLFSVSGILVGFTSSTVSVKSSPNSTVVKTYNEKGSFMFSK